VTAASHLVTIGANYAILKQGAEDRRRLDAELISLGRNYARHAKQFPRVRVRVLESFKLGPDCGFSPARWAQPNEIISIPEDLALWLCDSRSGARAERV
jgi:hypothetical protein